MRDLILKLYIRIRMFFKACLDLTKLIKFIYFLHKEKIFGKGDTTLILDVISKFISLENSDYSDKIIKSRSALISSALINNLTYRYKESHSEVVLNQLLTVLKEDFIERDLNNAIKF